MGRSNQSQGDFMRSGGSSRRDFLHTAAGLGAGVSTLVGVHARAGGVEPAALLPTVTFGPHRVTRLILGGNPVYGHSHFNRLFSQSMVDWHTPERVQELMRRCEECGINTMQFSYADRTLADVDRYRAAGGSMHWFCLGKGDWDEHPERVAAAARHGPIGIAPHGALGEKLHRAQKYAVLTDLLKRIRQEGVLVGLSAHDPALIEESESRGWDVDYYMCCLYYLTRPRGEFEAILGSDLPLGEIYLPSDPPRMLRVIQSTRKPCLVYKILAAGRRVGSAAEVRGCFVQAFEQIKPTDAVIVGMYQQFGDQVAENAGIVRDVLKA